MIESPHQVYIPHTDLASFVFSSGTPSSRDSPQYCDSACPSQCFSLFQAEVWVKQFAKGLPGLRLAADDKILLFSENCLLFPVFLWGVLAAGCVLTAVSRSASIRNSDAKVLFVGQKRLPTALEAAKQAGIDQRNVYLFCDSDETVDGLALQAAPWNKIWKSTEEGQSWSWKKIDTLKEARETTAIINYSSG
ncbi:unnamed protein product [Penicillium manginii]